MNGLKYIRTKCNLSSAEVAEILSVTRQAVSAWENGTKDIPEGRLAQLSDYFGIDTVYFGDICDKDIRHIDEKALFRHSLNGKEIYRMIPNESQCDSDCQMKYFDYNRKTSLNDELKAAQAKKKETLARISDIIDWSITSDISSKIMAINRNCNIYETINQLLEFVRCYDPTLKVPLLYEMKNVWKAMQLAYSLLDEPEIEHKENNEYPSEDGEWIVNLARQIKDHWEAEKEAEIKRFEQYKESHSIFPSK